VDPLFVISARLVDELLRTYGEARQVLDKRVPRLRPPTDIIRDSSSLMLAVEGKGEDALFEKLGLAGRLPTKYTHGYIYPEELSLDDVSYEIVAGIPLTWTNIQKSVWHADVTRDITVQRNLFWSAFFEKPWSSIRKYFEPQPNYAEIANITATNIITTRMNVQVFELLDWFAPPSSKQKSATRHFLLLDPQGVPLQTNTGLFKIPEADVPAEIRAWLDVASPKRV
jgi:hypothetical protein